MSAERLAYDDPDTTRDMAQDASACCQETHLARAADAFTTARRTAGAAPSALLATPRTATRTALHVSDSAARFASRLFE
jgi:hypothetical protein